MKNGKGESKPLGPLTLADMQLIHQGWMDYIKRKTEMKKGGK